MTIRQKLDRLIATRDKRVQRLAKLTEEELIALLDLYIDRYDMALHDLEPVLAATFLERALQVRLANPKLNQ